MSRARPEAKGGPTVEEGVCRGDHVGLLLRPKLTGMKSTAFWNSVSPHINALQTQSQQMACEDDESLMMPLPDAGVCSGRVGCQNALRIVPQRRRAAPAGGVMFGRFTD